MRPEELETWIATVLARCGMTVSHAASAAPSIVRADMRGRATHGVARLASYVSMLKEGSLNARPAMRAEERAGGILFDADGALGHVAAPEIVALGLKALIDRASVLVVVRDIGHLGALGIHTLTAAERGVFCLAGQQAPPVMALPGFKRAAIGNNPIAFACPRPGGPALAFDMACSRVARGHVILAAREGRPIPDDWAVGEAGMPTTDPSAALRGALRPVGGHKGVGIAMMVEVLAGALSASAASLARPLPQARDTGGSARVGAFFWFIDPGSFAGGELFEQRMAQWTGHYLCAGGGEARLPGEQAAVLEQRARDHGLALPRATVLELKALGERLGVPFPGLPAH